MGGYDGVILVIVMSEEKELVVDEEFKKLIPPLSDEEYSTLEECIVEEGCRDPLVLWGNVILDGHNRYDICMRRGLIFKTVEKNFDDRDDAMVWIIKNQFGRRNLTDGWKLELKARYKDLLREIGKKKLKTNVGGKHVGLSDNDKAKHNTRGSLAKDLGWSTGKVAEAEVVQKESPVLWDAVKKGEKSINSAYKEIKQEKASQEDSSKFNRTNDNIEWAIWTWNPVTGCKHGCTYCYARDIANRFYKQGFEPTFHENRLSAPKNTIIPNSDKDTPGNHNVFVCSMADLFGDWVPKEWIDKVLQSVKDNPQWTFLFLTKNPKKLLKFDFPKNSWVGTTVDVQSRVKMAEDVFKKLRSTVKFVSCEPLREKVVFKDMSAFDWVIIGGQSKCSTEDARQPEWSWVESLFNQARGKKIKIYFKPNLTVRPKEYPEV